MARPRVFLSSTFYDLRILRADLDRFIREQGYEPVLSERGGVAYGSEDRLEEDCYKEISTCDILVAIVGGRFGSESTHRPYSISQKELRVAIDLGKQVYVFVERAVYGEYPTYQANRNVQGFIPVAVDDIRVFGFLEEVSSLPGSNPVHTFETSADITSFLREQWAGLFQRLLQEAGRQKEVRLIEDMSSIIITLKQLVTFLSSEKERGDQAIRDILLSNHPVFDQLRTSLRIPYRVFFTSFEELESWISNRRFEHQQDSSRDDSDPHTWVNVYEGRETTLTVAKSIFDADGRLKIYTPEEWHSDWVQVDVREVASKDDDLPF